MRVASILAIVAVALGLSSCVARAEVTACISITALPTVITVQGIYCLKQDLATSATTGRAITINAHNVVIDLNGYKLGGLGGGTGTQADGIFAQDRDNITIRNGSVRGFRRGILLSGGTVHLVEDMRIESSRWVGLTVSGAYSIVRRNIITKTGGGLDTITYGILLVGDGLSAQSNFVTGVSASTASYGIYAYSTRAAVIEANEIREVGYTAASKGIFTSESSDNMIRGNTVVNTYEGGTGIAAEGLRDGCIGNAVSSRFTTEISGCEYSSGNHLF